MERTYTIPMYRRQEMEKAIARFERKAEAYGKTIKATFGEPYAKEVGVYVQDDVTRTQSLEGTTLVECFDLTLDAEVIRKDGYSVVAKIEHLEEANFVYAFTDATDERWFKCEPVCEHCGTKHFRKNTFIVRNEDGSERQVGSTCLKDYCGISPNVFASMRELTDIFEKCDVCDGFDADMIPTGEKVFSFEVALGYAFDIVEQYGYVRSDESGSNRSKLYDKLLKFGEPSEKGLSKAREMIERIVQIEVSDDYGYWLADKARWLVNNMNSLILNKYCKASHVGYIAYAPVAYENYMTAKAEYDAKKEANASAANKSSWIGNDGEYIEFDVSEMRLMTSWENDWGRYTYLYKFVDTDGNVLIWYASHTMETCSRISAKVKGHSERDGVKQTVITRCKAA